MKLLVLLALLVSLGAFAYGDESSDYDDRSTMPEDSDYEPRYPDDSMDQNKPMRDDDDDQGSYEKPMDDDYGQESDSDY